MDEILLNDVVRRIAVVLERRNIPHALIGGLAVGIRTRPRSMKDADFILNIPALSLPGVLEDPAADGFTLDITETIRRWSTDRMVTFYRGPIRVDWLYPVLPVYAKVLKTAESRPWFDTKVSVATAEGLILTKMIAFRHQVQGGHQDTSEFESAVNKR